MVHTIGTCGRARVVVKVLGTSGVVALLGYPLWAPQWGAGILGDIAAVPPAPALLLVAAFFGLVVLYCRALRRTLTLVDDRARTATPASVWWMLAIPYNFVEDFFILHAVGASLAADGRLPARDRRRWSTLGHGWCALQILSLFPGALGYAGGGVGLAVWAAHWTTTVRMNRRLAPRVGLDAPTAR